MKKCCVMVTLINSVLVKGSNYNRLTTPLKKFLKSLNSRLVIEIHEKSLNFNENFGRPLNFENDP